MEDPHTTITEEKITRYLETTRQALEKAKVVAPPKSFAAHMAASFREMAETYFSDAHVFAEKGDRVNAFACVNYAHGWLDAGARLGVFDVGEDDRLFTLLE
ncbi:MAG: DUF357 domain-containing protein [Euryarchaeota archaeon]|nr:DUF357 domain-containing protein [Euryarchaeota archaeon]